MFDTVFVTRGPEERAVRDALARVDRRPMVVATGIGPRAGELGAERALAAGRPRRALVVGTCGALSTALAVGDVLLYSRIRSPFEPPLGLEPRLATEIFAAYPEALSGIHGISSDRIATRAREKRALAARFQTQAVDMESHAIVRTLHAANVPVAVVRVVSDGATGDLPDLNRALTGSGEIDPSSLALTLLADPLGTLRLATNGGTAVGRLGTVVEAIFARRSAELASSGR